MVIIPLTISVCYLIKKCSFFYLKCKFISFSWCEDMQNILQKTCIYDQCCCLLSDMAPFYEEVCTELKWSIDKALLSKMKDANQKKLKELDEKQKDAEENLGETEIRDALYARAEYLTKIGDKVSKTLICYKNSRLKLFP